MQWQEQRDAITKIMHEDQLRECWYVGVRVSYSSLKPTPFCTYNNIVCFIQVRFIDGMTLNAVNLMNEAERNRILIST